MATRKENAGLLGEKLGVTINTDATNPKADVLQGWADRVETDPEGVKREILTTQVQDALDVELTDATLTSEQLQALLDEPDVDAARAALAELQGGSTSTGSTEPAPDAPTFTVRVNDTIAAYGGTFTDPDQAQGNRVIGADPVTAHWTPALARGLRDGTLVEAQD